jgi:hypothetical protein
MTFKPFAYLVTVVAAGAASIACAQSQYDPNENANPEPGQAYQANPNSYDAQRDIYARQREAYDRRVAEYRMERQIYQQRLRSYERARADYDMEFGPGAYERYYPAPPPPPDYDGPQ